MNKKLKFILLPIVIMVTCTLLFFNSSFYGQYSKSDYDAVRKARGEHYIHQVLHQEPIDGGIVIFYLHRTNERDSVLAADYIKHTLFGWKWVYGGMHSVGMMDEFNTDAALLTTFTEQYFPGTEGSEFGKSPFPMLFGQIKNSQVQNIIIEDKLNGKKHQAEVVSVNRNNKLWFSFVEKESKNFEIYANDSHGDLVVKKQATTNLSDQSSVSSGVSKVK